MVESPPTSELASDRVDARASAVRRLMRWSCSIDAWVLITLLIVMAMLLFANYGSGSFYRWDEGLYGQFARNALYYHNYAIPLGADGHYATEPFSKPPLSFLVVAGSFALLGPSIHALRLPFTLATAALALVCFSWGKALSPGKQGLALGFAWAVGLLMSTATLRWGRYAAIEPLFVLFLLLALWLHARSFRAAGKLTLLGAGLALMLAFFTKQLAFGLALAPIGCLELIETRRHGIQRLFTRASYLLGPSVVFGGLWAYHAHDLAGNKLSSMLLDFAIKQRLEGFAGKVHYNHINRVSRMLDEVSEPFSWSLGAAGLALLVLTVMRRAVDANQTLSAHTDANEPSRATTIAAPIASTFTYAQASILLLFLFTLTCALVFENVSKSTLPWYTYAFIPPLMLGNAWLVVGSFNVLHDKSWLKQSTWQAWPELARAGLGLAVLVLATERSFLSVGSQLDAVLGLLSAALVLAFLAHRFPALQAAFRSSRALLAVAAAALACLLFCRLRDEEFRQEPSAMGQLMTAIARTGAHHVAVDTDIRKWDPKDYEIITLFGTRASITSAPWNQPDPALFDAYVQLAPVPSELQPAPGVELFRTAGAVLWSGDLSSPPMTTEHLAELLWQGPLTFEAEQQNSESSLSLGGDSLASGKKARSYVPWLSSIKKDHAISSLRVDNLPPDEYVAVFYVRYACGPYKSARVGTLRVDSDHRTTESELPCKEAEHRDSYEAFPVPFYHRTGAKPELEVIYRKGRGSLWHDKTELWRAELWNKH